MHLNIIAINIPKEALELQQKDAARIAISIWEDLITCIKQGIPPVDLLDNPPEVEQELEKMFAEFNRLYDLRITFEIENNDERLKKFTIDLMEIVREKFIEKEK